MTNNVCCCIPKDFSMHIHFLWKIEESSFRTIISTLTYDLEFKGLLFLIDNAEKWDKITIETLSKYKWSFKFQFKKCNKHPSIWYGTAWSELSLM